MEKVAGRIEVRLADDLHHIVINDPDVKLDARKHGDIVLSPRDARHLANLLTDYAEDAEAT